VYNQNRFTDSCAYAVNRNDCLIKAAAQRLNDQKLCTGQIIIFDSGNNISDNLRSEHGVIPFGD
jgi:hypothetical protein